MTAIVFGSKEADQQLREDRIITYLEQWSRGLIELDYWIPEIYLCSPDWKMMQFLLGRGEWKRKRGIDGRWMYRPKNVTEWKKEDSEA